MWCGSKLHSVCTVDTSNHIPKVRFLVGWTRNSVYLWMADVHFNIECTHLRLKAKKKNEIETKQNEWSAMWRKGGKRREWDCATMCTSINANKFRLLLFTTAFNGYNGKFHWSVDPLVHQMVNKHDAHCAELYILLYTHYQWTWIS